MNQDIYKLVFSRVLGMLVPVSEATSAYGNSCRAPRRTLFLLAQLTHFAILFTLTLAKADMPAGLSVRQIVNDSTRISASTANSIHFQQLKPRAIVDWNTLNLSRGQSFNVDMLPTWSMLNRIHDNNPSYINGLVNARGNLYFLNPYGIIIGKDAQFNVGSIYAGTLDMTNELFEAGFVNDTTFTEAFKLVGVLDPADQARIDSAEVLIEGGAQINTAKNGKVLLFAPNVKVEKEGVVTNLQGEIQKDAKGNVLMRETLIRTPEGQTILAAGEKVYLKSSKDPAGFLVEVDAGGTATNLGKIIAEQGNITMMGLAVNQAGILSATTSVRANGSISLIAQDGVTVGAEVTGKRNGIVRLSEGSVTEVRPEVENKEETIVSQAFKTSRVNIDASLIEIDGKIRAQGGDVVAINRADASAELGSLITRRIFLGDQAEIDVSGVDAVAPMSRNQLEVQLFSDQLKDAPILRGGPLFRETVYVDARKGTELFDIQPFLNLKPATVAEKMSGAGSITLSTAEDLIVSKNAVMDVSGGSITYMPGRIKESNLIYNGKLVRISEAKPGLPYSLGDTYSVTDAKWGTTRSWNIFDNSSFVKGYTEGVSAGKLNLTTDSTTEITKNLLLAGTVKADTVVGREQRISGEIPQGGTLIASARNLDIVGNISAIAPTFEGQLPDTNNFRSQLSTDIFVQGFNHVDLTKTEKLSVNAPINLAPEGDLTLSRPGSGNEVQINANITAPAGDIKLNGEITKIADNVTISTAGRFTNDGPKISNAFTVLPAQNGGNISANLVQFGRNVTLDSSAGLWIDSNGKLHEGDAGDIRFGVNSNLDPSLKLQSLGFDEGGHLTISFGALSQKTLSIGQGNAGADFRITPDFFSRGGFSEYTLSAHNVLIGDDSASKTEIYGQAQNWRLNPNALMLQSGQPMSMVAKPVSFVEQQRQPVSLDFVGARVGDTLGTLKLAENATLRTDIGGTVSLLAGKQVNVLGDIKAPGGQISIGINDGDPDLPKDPTQAVFIGDKANLSVAGTSMQMLDSLPNLLKNRVIDAGSITINNPSKQVGGVPKGAVIIKNGAVLDASGASVLTDTQLVRGYQRETLYGDAGNITLYGSDSLLIDGDFKAQAQGSGRDGTFNLIFNPLNVTDKVILTDQKQLSTQNFTAGDSVSTNAQLLKAQLSAQQLENAGFANANIKSFLSGASNQSQIDLAGDVNLNLQGNLRLETARINVSGNAAQLTANHITFKSAEFSHDPATILAGNATLMTNSKQLYTEGLTAISGTKQVTFNTSADIHGQGALSNAQVANVATESGVVTNGELVLNARQIHPETGAKLTFEALGDGSKLTVISSGAPDTNVLSAGGTLTLKADDIVQNGVIKAPFGQINLVGKESVTLSDGSKTSVTGSGQLIPYSQTTTGGQVYNPSGGTQSRSLPEKNINIASKNVDMQSGAELNLSGGGDVFAYEFIPGIGGSQDILAQPNTYAIIPGVQQAFAPRDLVYQNSSSPLGVGQTVYLTGVAGLASGTYTLMPARYALVPGAFMVQLKSNVQTLPGQVIRQLDGSSVTSGYFADATGARDANWSSFQVTNGSILRPQAGEISRSPSQYIITNASSFFSNPQKTAGIDVDLPKDAGRLSIAANNLNLDSNVIANRVSGGSGMLVDISADKIRLVSAKDVADTESLQLTVDNLKRLDAESLLLGGTRSTTAEGTLITTTAQTVSIENDSANPLNKSEFIASAKDKVTVNSGAVLGAEINTGPVTNSRIIAQGEGALLALSSSNNITYSRTGASSAATMGTLDIATGSNLSASKSLVVDATKEVKLNSNISLQDGSSATFGANRILLGAAPASESGLTINEQRLASLGELASLSLNSYGNVDTYGTVSFGNDKLDLTVNAAGIVGHLADGETSAPAQQQSLITAKTFTLKNNQDATFVASADPSGRQLTINANKVRFEGEIVSSTSGQPSVTTINGYDALNINANEIAVAQQGEANFNVAETNLNTGRLGGETAANFSLKSNATLNVAQLTNAAVSSDAGFGAKLGIEANALNVAGNIDTRSGQLSLKSNTDLNIGSESNIRAGSTPITYYNTTRHVDAGTVTLSSITGNVNVATGAVVDVTAQGNADAGSVKVVADAGTLNLNGELRGAAAGSGDGGVLDVRVNTLANLSVTNANAKGFSEGRHYRVRNGDVNISGSGDNALAAREISVATDTGKIEVTGNVIATASKDSRIGLYANNGVVLQSTAQLKANTTKAGEEGGIVNIHTKTAALDLQAGSSIDVSGGQGGEGGQVNLRAPRTGGGSGNGVAVTNLASNILGAESTVLEGFRTYLGVTSVTTGTGTGATLGQTTVANDVSAFMANRNAILASLGKTGDNSFHLRAGTEIQSNTSLTIGPADWNLYSTNRAGGEPGVLTLRAKDNITFSGSLSDGFVTAASNSAIGTGDSWSYRIVSGADFGAANVMSTTAVTTKDANGNATTGNVILNNGTATNTKLIRTGTGSIEIATGGDLRLGGVNTAIYTAGKEAGSLAGFDIPSSNNPLYLAQGGDISIISQGNIVGGESLSGRQLINQWLFREGGGSQNRDTTWWVRPDLFRQGLATLGGGDINIVAGGNISNFSASAPTTARFDNFGNELDPATGAQRIDGGGDLRINAGGNINNGVYFVAKGDGEISAQGNIGQQGNTFGTLLATQDGRFDVKADGNVAIEAVINPTMVAQSTVNGPVIDATGRNSYFNSYAETAAVVVSSLRGNASLGGNANILSFTTGLDNGITASLNYLPGNIGVVSHSASATLGDGNMLPSPIGQLEVLAANNVTLGTVEMSDASVDELPNLNKPLSRTNFPNFTFRQLKTHDPGLLHNNDNNPSLIVARTGDVSSSSGGVISLAESAKIFAGRDVGGLNVAIQNIRSSDVAVIKAGRDIRTQNVAIAGPGELLMQAGRNIDLVYPNDTTVNSTGSSGSSLSIFQSSPAANPNPALPSEGASITLQAGLGEGAALQNYIDRYISPSGAGPATLSGNQARLEEFRASTRQQLTDYMRKYSGNDNLTDDQAFVLFASSDDEVKAIFANRHLTSELIASAQDFKEAGNHNRGNGAISTLFPMLNQGDILLFNSKVSTNSGGSIDLLAPGGFMNVGVTGEGGDIGVITEKGGAIRAVADGDFQVNQSKVITQFGSDIAIWSSKGTIDAGRGSKTATSVPERIVQTDAHGNTTIEVRGVAAGSGIRAQSYDPDGPNGPAVEPKKGTVFLTAPIVDAGEAGIEAGDIFVVAPVVLNAANIQVQGASSGVPVAATGAIAGVGAGLSPDAVNSAAQAVAQNVAQSASNNTFQKPQIPSIISVDVISIGK